MTSPMLNGWRRGRGLALAGGLVVALVTVPTVSATYPGANGRIASAVPVDGRDRIFLIDPNGDNVRQITHADASDLHPAVSADGRMIAFDRYRGNTGFGVYLIDVGGGRAHHIAKTDSRDSGPVFSPPGDRLAFESYRAGSRSQIWTRRIDGTHPRQLTDAHAESYSPAYSPDGRRIVFVRSYHLFIMRSDGSHVRRLTKGRYDASPAFSPDGGRISFTRDDDVYILKLNGHRLHRLTRTKFAEGTPRFSPDGRRIAFSRAESQGGDFSSRGVFVMHVDGTHERRLRDLPSAGLDWQPLAG
jgi:TolB protein